MKFPVWLGIPKPMIPSPLLWEGAVRTIGSHLGCILNYSEVPDNPLPQGTPAPLLEPPLPAPPPLPAKGSPANSWLGG